MTKLTGKARSALPASSFGLPAQRKFPMPDKSHAANAKARATQAVNAGKMAPKTAATVDAKANQMLGHADTYGKLQNAEGSKASAHFANMKRLGK